MLGKKRLNGESLRLGHSLPVIGEQLFAETADLLNAAKEARIRSSVKFVWCRDGRIWVYESEQMPAIRITDYDQLRAYGVLTSCSEVSDKDLNKGGSKKRNVEAISSEDN